MTTYTHDGDGAWAAPMWAIGTSTVVGGPPGPGDVADVNGGTVDLAMPLYDLQISMIPMQDITAEIVATNVELGDNVALTGDSEGGSIYYEVVGTGTLDDGHQTNGLAPKPGAIVSNTVNIVLAAGGGSDTPIFINDGAISGGLAISAAAGTRIATPDGEVAVEALRPGDHVRLASGGGADVRWVGHRRVWCDRHPRPHGVFPVRIRAGAFAPGQPARDLLLSPDHAVFADGVLIPMRCLLNGATISQEPAPRLPITTSNWSSMACCWPTSCPPKVFSTQATALLQVPS